MIALLCTGLFFKSEISPCPFDSNKQTIERKEKHPSKCEMFWLLLLENNNEHKCAYIDRTRIQAKAKLRSTKMDTCMQCVIHIKRLG